MSFFVSRSKEVKQCLTLQVLYMISMISFHIISLQYQYNALIYMYE